MYQPPYGWGYPPPNFYYGVPQPLPPQTNVKKMLKQAKKLAREKDELEKKIKEELEKKDKDKSKDKKEEPKSITKKDSFSKFEVFSLLTLLSPIVGPAYIMLILSFARTIAEQMSTMVK